MVNIEIRLIIFFAAKDGEALYSHQKQDRELTVAQIMNSLLPKASELVLLILRVDFLHDELFTCNQTFLMHIILCVCGVCVHVLIHDRYIY